MGIYAKNREEWAVTDLACLRSDITIVPFFESLGHEALSFVLNQTQVETMCIEKDKIDLLIKMKKEECKYLKNLVVFDTFPDSKRQEALENGITLYSYNEIIK